MKKVFILILLIGFLNTKTNAQVYLGAKYGFYTPFIAEESFKYYKIQNSFNPPSYNTGITLDFPLKGEHAFFNTGVSYFSMSDLKYISIPLNFKAYFGKVFQPFFNLGCYSSIQLSNIQNYKQFDFGLNLGVGFLIKISEKIKIDIDYQKYLGLATAYVENTPSHFGQNNYLNESNSFGFCNIGFIYKLEILNKLPTKAD